MGHKSNGTDSPRFLARRLRRREALLLLCSVPIACDMPRDPEHSLERARRGALRVGASEHPPWVVRGEREPSGKEVELVRGFAAAIGSRVAWHWGATDALLTELEDHRLDLVIAGLAATSPWKRELGFSQPHDTSGAVERVIAVAPGENALLFALDRYILKGSA